MEVSLNNFLDIPANIVLDNLSPSNIFHDTPRLKFEVADIPKALENDVINEFLKKCRLPFKQIPVTDQTVFEHIVMCNYYALAKWREQFEINAVMIDGVACCGKTNQKIKLGKVNRNVSTFGIDTSSPDALGYCLTNGQYMVENVFNFDAYDRSLFNNMDWFFIWRALMQFRDKNFEYHEITTFFENIIETSMGFEQFKWFQNIAPKIIIVDSDISENHLRLANRNIGSDFERSKWPHYIIIQYIYYVLLVSKYSDCSVLIDLARYMHNFDEVHDAIQYLVIEYNNKRDTTNIDGIFSEKYIRSKNYNVAKHRSPILDNCAFDIAKYEALKRFDPTSIDIDDADTDSVDVGDLLA